MKKIFISIAAIFMIVAFTTKVMAQSSTDTKPNNANAKILGAIALTVVSPLEFGNIAPGTGGTVVVDVLNVRSQTGGVVLVGGTTPTAASYTVASPGEGNASYVITIPTASFNITNTTGEGGETMAVTTMICSKGGSSTFTSGSDAFTVGGTLNVLSAQVPGIYTGTFDVTVAYN